MKNTKYNYNKSSHAFFDSINQQQSKFYANNMMPMSQQKPQMPLKRGGSNIFMGNENVYYVNGIDVSNQNGCHYYDQAQQQQQQQQQQHINSNAMVLTNHNMASGGRQRYAPYSYQKRSYDHALPPAKQPRFYNYSQPSQSQALVSSNLMNISAEQNSPSESSFRLVSVCSFKNYFQILFSLHSLSCWSKILLCKKILTTKIAHQIR